MSNKIKLDSLRDRIDAVDEQLQELINRRAALAREVAEVKTGQGETADFYRPDREADVLRRIGEALEDARGDLIASMVLDAGVLATGPVNAHPLQNDMTTALAPRDLLKFLEAENHPPEVIDFSAD